MDHKYTNQLIHESSPYLLQHAHNPVNWHPWGAPALEKAKQEDKLILVSIGYSACHWCHVMERESFEDEDTAAYMNKHFVNIKIDREERPDLDHIYMDAVQAITGSGGWPLNVFLTPLAKPFYGGTYFPPVKAFNLASWKEVLENVAQAWTERRPTIEAQAENLVEHISKSGNFSLPPNTALSSGLHSTDDVEKYDEIFAVLMQSADTVWGGFGRAPKFPQTFVIRLLLQYQHFAEHEGALVQALLSIDKMLEGGIYDHVAGGLARYSTDNEWLAPHFEKMLYDNALLVMALCDAYQVTKLKRYETAIRKTIDFISSEMLDKGGGFYAALDADSEGEEGRFYVWQKEEIEAILGADAALFCKYFDISETGNWEGKNILRILKNAEQFAPEHGYNEAAFKKKMEDCLGQLKIERSKRVRPGLDDKIILGWNALMMKAIAMAATVLQDGSYRELALANFNFLIDHFPVNGSGEYLLHTWKNGEAKHPAYLDDYAYLADACITMYELAFDTAFLEKAKALCLHVIDHFSDHDEIFFYYTHKNQQDIIVRKKEIYDGAIPSANAVMASNLMRLGIIFDIETWRSRSDKMTLAVEPAVIKYPASFAVWAAVLMQKIKGPAELVLVGKNALSTAGTIASRCYIPQKIMMASEVAVEIYPMLKGKPGGDPAYIYICNNYMCGAPLKDINEFYTEIKSRKI